MNDPKKCSSSAMFRYTWPGKDEAFCCAEHAFGITRVAKVIGCHLQMHPITPDFCKDAWPECSSHVKEKAPKIELIPEAYAKGVVLDLGNRSLAKPPVYDLQENKGEFSRAEQRIIDSLGFWKSVGIDQPSRPQIAAVAGYSVRSSGFEKIISILSTKNVIHRPASGLLSLTNAAHVGPMDTDQAKAKFMSVMGGAQQRVINAFSNGEDARADIAQRSGYSVTSSGFEKTLSQLSSMGVIVRTKPGYIALAEWVREIL